MNDLKKQLEQIEKEFNTLKDTINKNHDNLKDEIKKSNDTLKQEITQNLKGEIMAEFRIEMKKTI
jgi:DNA repair ATPase RecN